MPGIAREQENQPDIINWFTTINGVLTDMYEIGFRIFDITGGLPGTQIFPTTPGDYEDVTTGNGNFSVGSYYAYDNTAGTGWTPGVAEPVGTHRIEWRWKSSASAPYQAGQEDFEVLVQSGGSSSDTYCSVQDIRDEGLTDTTLYPDAKVLGYIETWQEWIERVCRQWFVPKTKVFNVDGNGADTLFFCVPIISIDYVKINDSNVNLDAELYRVYSSREFPDDRRNPRIALRNTLTDPRDIYMPLFGPQRFNVGKQNQEIKGTFGFVTPDGGTPALIKRALIKMVVEKLTKPIYVNPSASTGPAPPPILGPILEEVTDDHKIKYGSPGGPSSPRKPGLTGFTNDWEILETLRLFKGPIGIGAPAHWSYNF